ncbi:hypothetical protein BU16DRAFT_534585 [Lophium mytilinum]|uniref:Uncharacterized protein n=1 Tax=Lophium mytilinum TaxID=390894 RepID=A0A6A6R5U7_9PEZI|nr:hypothetical protein BU16DRAFT_534585 [Lophium mytilinum]
MAPPAHHRDCVWDGESWSHHAADCVLHDEHLLAAKRFADDWLDGKFTRAKSRKKEDPAQHAKEGKSTAAVVDQVKMGDTGSEDRLATVERRLEALEAWEKQMMEKSRGNVDPETKKGSETTSDQEQRRRLLAEIDSLKEQLRVRHDQGLKTEEALSTVKGTLASGEKEIRSFKRLLNQQKEEGDMKMIVLKRSKDKEFEEMKRAKGAEIEKLQGRIDENAKSLYELGILFNQHKDMATSLEKNLTALKAKDQEEIRSLRAQLALAQQETNALKTTLSSIKDAVNMDVSERPAKRPRIDYGGSQSAAVSSPPANFSLPSATQTPFEKLQKSYSNFDFIALHGNARLVGSEFPHCLREKLAVFIPFFHSDGVLPIEDPKITSKCLHLISRATVYDSQWPKDSPGRQACRSCSRKKVLCVVLSRKPSSTGDKTELTILPLRKELRETATTDPNDIGMWITRSLEDVRAAAVRNDDLWE